MLDPGSRTLEIASSAILDPGSRPTLRLGEACKSNHDEYMYIFPICVYILYHPILSYIMLDYPKLSKIIVQCQQRLKGPSWMLYRQSRTLDPASRTLDHRAWIQSGVPPRAKNNAIL